MALLLLAVAFAGCTRPIASGLRPVSIPSGVDEAALAREIASSIDGSPESYKNLKGLRWQAAYDNDRTVFASLRWGTRGQHYMRATVTVENGLASIGVAESENLLQTATQIHRYAKIFLVRLRGRVATAVDTKSYALMRSAPPVRVARSSMQIGRADAREYESGYRRRVAVVIGVDDYRSWPPLEGAVNDARHVRRTLEAIGFDEVQSHYDGHATRERILDVLGHELPRTTTEEDLVVVFFAGHGQTETLGDGRKHGYIIPVEGDPDRPFATAISMDRIRALSNRIPAKHIYFAMDSCYSGIGFQRGIAPSRRDSGYLAKLTQRRSVQMITAGSDGEAALESYGRGLFTMKLVEALRGKADFNGDGAVTANEVGTFVRPAVSRASGHRQTPQFGTLEGSGEVVLRAP